MANAERHMSAVRIQTTDDNEQRAEGRRQRTPPHLSGKLSRPALRSRSRSLRGIGTAPCALSHWINLRPVSDGSLPVGARGGKRLSRRLVLQIVTDIVFIVTFEINNGFLQH